MNELTTGSPRRDSFRALCGWIVAGTGLSTLAGWALSIDVLKSPVRDAVTMKPNTALLFVIAGLAVALYRPGSPRRMVFFGIASAILGAIALLTLVEFAIGVDFRIDQMLFREDRNPRYTATPGRMALPTAVGFLLVGLALPLVARRGKPSGIAARLLASATGVIGALTLLGYLYAAPNFYAPARGMTTVAIHTAACFVLLSAAILAARAEGGWTAVFIRQSLTADLARKVLPVGVVAFTVSGLLHLALERTAYGPELTLATFSIANIAILVGLVAWWGRMLDDAERAREEANVSLAESQEQFRAIFEQAAVGIAQVGLDGTFLRINERFAEIAGHPREQLLGLTFQQITHPADLGADLGFVRDMLAGRIDTYSMEKRYIRQDGSIAWINLTVSLVRSGSGAPKYFVGVIQDIAKRKRAEQALAEAHVTLERRVEERTGELSRERDRLEKLSAELMRVNRELEAFSYSVSHDLRAPLRAIEGFSRILREKHADALEAAGHELFRRVEAATAKMSRLIDDLIELARVSRREMHVRRVDLSEIARRVVDEIRMGDGQRNVDVRIDEKIEVEADPVLLEVVLRNLLSNAWKFTSKKPRATIELRRADGDVVFVRDDGAGFDMQFAANLFRAFERLHPQDEFEGTGIGLATVQRILHRHGGKVWAEAAPNQGATFFFSIPQPSQETQ